jgi:hypothetical protein
MSLKSVLAEDVAATAHFTHPKAAARSTNFTSVAGFV